MREASEHDSFGALLRAHRIRLGLTQEALAEQAGLSRRGIADLERGARRAPYADTVDRLAVALGLGTAEQAALVEAARPVRRLASDQDQQTAESATAGDASLGTNVFVGRDVELQVLRSACERAAHGNGGFVLVLGEPGIGKTALCGQLTAYARSRGMEVLTGGLYEEPSLALPYLPFIEALRRYARSVSSERLLTELGPGAPDVARVLPDLQTRLGIEPRQRFDPEQDRWSLLSSFTDFIRAAAATRPLVLLLEDLQWADRGTLDLLLFLSRNLGGSRLLVIGTYRDAEVARSHPLASALVELRRGPNFTRLPLRGLNANDVQTMLSALANQDVSLNVAQTLHDQTEGNPLFVQEIVHDLIETGFVARVGDRWASTSAAPLASTLPEGLRDVIGKRLSRLSADCNQVLAVAAVIGREFALATLQRTVDLDDELLLGALEDAQHARVIEDTSVSAEVTFRFSHALFRQTLYEELFAPRRLLLHQRVARALEARYASDPDEHAGELAEHFAQSTDSEDLTKALRYAYRAADRAAHVSAHGETARHLRSALQVQRILEPHNTESQCDLLLSIGDAIVDAGETAELTATSLASEALGLAEALGDRNRAFAACFLGVKSLSLYGGIAAWDTPEFRPWAEGMQRYSAEGTHARVRADGLMANVEGSAGREDAARQLRLEALEVSRRLAAASTEPGWRSWRAYHVPLQLIGGWTPAAHRQTERLELTEEFVSLSVEDSELPTLTSSGITSDARVTELTVALMDAADAYLTFGQRSRAEAQWSRLPRSTGRMLPHSTLMLHRAQMIQGCLDGDFQRIRGEASAMLRDAERLGAGMLARFTVSAFMRRTLLYTGDVDEALAGYPEMVQRAAADDLPMFGLQGVFAAQRAVCLAHAERLAEADAVIDHFLRDRPIGDPPDETPMPVVIALLEAAVLTGHKVAVQRLVEHLAIVADLIAAANSLTVIARHMSAAMVLLGDRAQALKYAEQAVEIATKVRFRPEAALARLQFAELQPDNAASLEPVVSELRAMNMRPGLRRALDLLWHGQAQLARQACTEQRTEAARSASAAAWRSVEELTALESDDSKRQALRRAARRAIPTI